MMTHHDIRPRTSCTGQALVLARISRFRGVSRALLTALENRAAERGNVRCTLTGTETARRFYQANGYVEDGRLDGKFGTSASYAMWKLLATKDS